ncbi:MAG: hypothetical protein QG662_607 [Pseudomonadota bacterium]|nr:hypothetical protein [Pseudomonadota bacterium]
MKKILALAIASAFAAPAFAATSNVDVYGALGISIEDTNASNVGMQVTDRQSRIGFKGSEDLGGGLKAIWQIEQAISATAGGQDGVGGATLANRNSFVGLSGGFGTVLMGRHDTPYKLATAGKLDAFADTMGDVNAAGNLATSGEAGRSNATQLIHATHDARPAQAIAYISPNFSGFTFAGAIVATNLDGNGVNDNQNNSNMDAVSLSGTYENGPLYAALAYQEAEDISTAAGTQDSAAWKIGAGYKFGDVKVGFVYEDVELVGNDLQDALYGNVAYSMGAITLKAQYGELDVATGADASKLTLGVDYNLSKRTNVYALYDMNDTDGKSNLDGWAMGVRHSF